ncbi:integrator complex subunit 3-like [Lineus longissimus]|uniref:integrator complex subunit 3-like n=1 Tax=Lineus longissimus TaxID=88925 RepID=UPI002B4D21F6
MVMDQNKQNPSRVLSNSVLDAKDELDERLERCYKSVMSMVARLSDREANDVLNAHASKGSPQHEEIQLGLFFSILVDPKTAQRCYRDLTLVSRDSLNTVLTKTNQIIHEKWLKLRDVPRGQIVWFCKEMVKSNVTGVESVCLSLLKQMAGGDVSQKNIWLVESMLDLFIENKSWVDKHSAVMAMAVYTYLRLILDHGNPTLSALRQREVEFCTLCMREKFPECMLIGRDLVRLLQYVARIPEFESIWRDMLQNPTNLSPTFTGIAQLMLLRTPKKFFASRLTPDMENKLTWLMNRVKFGQQKRYQDWFQRQYLSTPESQSLRCDLIRYICAVIHPSNEILCSDVIPRWAVIGWLLTTCTSNVAASNAKLSLFYDWLFFEKDKDSIMNIEPAILVMYHSMRPHPAITATLLDFMCRIMPNFYPTLASTVRSGIFSALRSILEKRVLQSLSPLFDNPKLDRELRSMLRENFTEFCSQEVKEEAPNDKDMLVKNMMVVMEEEPNNHIAMTMGMSDGNSISDAAFSDEEEEVVPVSNAVAEKPKTIADFKPIKPPEPYQTINVSDYIEQLDGDLRNCLEQLRLETSNEARCEVMDKSFIPEVIQDELFDLDTAELVATCLCNIMADQFNKNLFPNDFDEESVADSIGTPLFVLFWNLSSTHEDDPSRQPLLLLLGEMYKKQPRVGYHLLYFLKVRKVNDEKMLTYRDFCKSLESKDLESCLITDLKLCQEDDVRLFTYLLPDVYTQFPNIAIGNTDLLYLIVSSIDGTQLQDLICQILQGHLVMFRKDSFLAVLNASLEWETLEQYFLWQLIGSHNIPVEHILPILPKLEFSAHAEALACILIQLKQECPTAELVRCILCRESKKLDFFAVSILKYWAQEYEDRLADLILSQVQKNTTTSNRKRQRTQSIPNNKKENPSVEQILSHLDHMRQTCRNISFLTNESMQQALQLSQACISDELKKSKFSDLLAFAEDLEDMKTTRVLRGGRKATVTSPKAGKVKKMVEDSDTESESSDNEEIVRQKNKKRKTVPSALDNDSD